MMTDDRGAGVQAAAPVAPVDDVMSDGVADDPAWRLTAWLLPVGAAASALLTLAQTLAGGVSGTTGYPVTVALLLLAAALLRDARRRARQRRWVRGEVHEFLLPLSLLLVTLILLAHGGAVGACVPACAALVLVGWEIAHAPSVARVTRLLPHALPVVGGTATAPAEPTDPENEDGVEAIVRDVLDGLPPEIARRMEGEGWTVEVRPAMAPQPPDEIVYGCCFYAAHVIAIYRRPHLLYSGRGERLRRAVTYTVLHEIAHALGLDETGVRRLGWLAETRPRPQAP